MRAISSTLRLVTQETVDRANALADEYPEAYRAARQTIETRAQQHTDPSEVAALAFLLLPSFVPTGQEHHRSAWRNAAWRAVNRCAAVVAATHNGEAVDPADLADDSKTVLPTYAPDPAAAYSTGALDRIAAALLALDDEHREPMRLAAVNMRHGQRTLTTRETSSTERRKIAAAVRYLSAHRARIERPADEAWTPSADWTDAAPLADRIAARSHDWTPGTVQGSRRTGPQPVGPTVTVNSRSRIAADGPQVTIPPERIAAADARRTAQETALTAAHGRPAHLAAKSQEARSRGLYRAAARLAHRALIAAEIAPTQRLAPAADLTTGTLAAETGERTVTVRPVVDWTDGTETPLPDPSNLRERITLATRQEARPAGHTLGRRTPLPVAHRPAQVEDWQTPGGTARPLASPTVSERLMDTGTPGTEVTRIRVTALNGTDRTDRYAANGHAAVEATRPLTTAAERRALSTALGTPAAVITTPAGIRTAPGMDPAAAALADRIAAAPRHGAPRKASSRKRTGAGSTGPTVPARLTR